jgi:hypothetical protein
MSDIAKLHEWIAIGGGRGADLRGADLARADLTDADLRGADLRGANLRGANLTRANLSAIRTDVCAILAERIVAWLREAEGIAVGEKAYRSHLASALERGDHLAKRSE